MPKPVVASIGILVISFTGLIWLINSTPPGPLWAHFTFGLLSFIIISLSSALLLYFARLQLLYWLNQSAKVFPNLSLSDKKKLYRQNLKIATPVATFASLWLFLKLTQLLTLINLILTTFLTLALTFYLYLRSRD